MRFRVDFKSGKPAYLQIIEQVQASVESGELRPGDPLPTIAVLAEELRLNRNAISKAYIELERVDVTEAAPGGGYIVRDRQSPLQDRRRKALMATGTLSELPADRHPPLQNAYSFVKRIIGAFSLPSGPIFSKPSERSRRRPRCNRTL